MNPLEIVAASLGLINVILVVRRSVWNYPFALAMVTLYAWIFAQPDVRLYSDALLQIFFFAVNVYGWRHWRQAQTEAGEVRVRWLDGRSRVLVALAIAGATAGWGTLMLTLTDAAVPFPDAFIAMASIAAQILLARRFVDNWAIWVAVDLVAIGVYAIKGLPVTAILYCVFLGLSVWGWIDWQRRAKTSTG